MTLLTAKEVAEKILDGKLSAHTIRRYANEGKLPCIRISNGSKMLFEKKRIIEFFSESKFIIPAKA